MQAFRFSFVQSDVRAANESIWEPYSGYEARWREHRFQCRGELVEVYQLGEFPLGEYPLAEYLLGEYPLGEYPQGEYPLGEYPLGEYQLEE